MVYQCFQCLPWFFCCCNFKELKKNPILSGPQISKKKKKSCIFLLSTAVNVVLYLVVQNPQQLNTWIDFRVLPEKHGARVRSFPEMWTGSSWLMEEICSMGSVKQGREAQEELCSCCPGMFWGFNMTEPQAWLDFSVDPAVSRWLDCSLSRGHLHSLVFWDEIQVAE